MAEIIEGLSLAGRTKSNLDPELYADIRETALRNPGQAVVVSKRPKATDTSDPAQRKQLMAVATKLGKESTLEAPFKVATGIKLIDNVAVAVICVNPIQED